MSKAVNVQVVVRCRPLSSRETERGSTEIVTVTDGTGVHIRNPRDASDKAFTFDHGYFTDSTQQQVYDDIGRPIVDKALQGYNGTIFAYGQTGSGKTHTMMGSDDDIGVIPLMNQDIFSRVADIEAAGTKFLITVSFLEIYNEVVKDLLNPSDKFLKIREHPDMGIYVENLAELIVRDPQEVENLIEQGNKVRQVAATQMNERSSRSHSCFTIKINLKSEEQVGDITRETCTSAKINLVDLAGSERAAKTGATGDRLKEGAAINKSLSALGNVINMLADRSKGGHVPYRDSKLTRLLQESLGGNSLTVMVAAISPADYNYDETVGTLQYADRAKNIKNATKKNEDINEKMIRELREEIDRLREMVQSGASSDQPAGTAGDTSNMEEMIANLERAKQQSWEEKERLAALYKEEREKHLNNEQNVLKFMQTVKEEKIDAIKRVRGLQQRKAASSKLFRLKKENYGKSKNMLQTDMKQYQGMLKEAETATGEDQVAREDELQILLDRIEKTRKTLVDDRDSLADLKADLASIEDTLIEERAEMAAKSAVLQEDDSMRKAIQDDERGKMALLKTEYLETALLDERERLTRETELERTRLEQVYASSGWSAKEAILQKSIKKYKVKERTLKGKLVSIQASLQAHQLKTRHVFQELVLAFNSEKRTMESQYHEVLSLLQQAQQDMNYLIERNGVLEEELSKANCWEPTIE